MADTPEMIAAIRAGCSPWHERPCEYPLCDCAPVVPDMIRAAIAAHEAARSPADDGWRPIETYLREHDPGADTYWGNNALLFIPTGERAPASDYRIIAGRLEADMWLGYDDDGAMFAIGTPTHWRPLPAPPADPLASTSREG